MSMEVIANQPTSLSTEIHWQHTVQDAVSQPVHGNILLSIREKVENLGGQEQLRQVCNINCITTTLLLLLLLSTWGRCCRISLHTATVHLRYFKEHSACITAYWTLQCAAHLGTWHSTQCTAVDRGSMYVTKSTRLQGYNTPSSAHCSCTQTFHCTQLCCSSVPLHSTSHCTLHTSYCRRSIALELTD